MLSAVSGFVTRLLGTIFDLPSDDGEALTDEEAVSKYLRACFEGDLEYVKDHIHLLNCSDRQSDSPLGSAALNGQTDVVRFFCAQGGACNLEILDADKCTPLMLAASAAHSEIVTILISHGARIRKADCNGWTALHYACAGGSLKIVKALVAEGADLLKLTLNNEACLYMAAHEGHFEVAQYLLKEGCDPRTEDSLGRKAADVAEDDELITLLNQYEAQIIERESKDAVVLEANDEPMNEASGEADPLIVHQ